MISDVQMLRQLDNLFQTPSIIHRVSDEKFKIRDLLSHFRQGPDQDVCPFKRGVICAMNDHFLARILKTQVFVPPFTEEICVHSEIGRNRISPVDLFNPADCALIDRQYLVGVLGRLDIQSLVQKFQCPEHGSFEKRKPFDHLLIVEKGKWFKAVLNMDFRKMKNHPVHGEHAGNQ